MKDQSAYNYDVVVVGAGNAALCAAIASREKGLQVLMLERAPQHKKGGNSYFTDGAMRFSFQGLEDIRKIIPELTDEDANRIEMPEYSIKNYYDDLMRVTENQSDPELAAHLTGESYNTIKWMHSQGITFVLNYENQSFIKDGKSHFWGGLPVKTYNIGVGLIEQLNARAEKMGVDIWYEARAIHLHKENNKIKALDVEKDGSTLTIETSSIVMACGGFEANKKMRGDYIGPEWEAAIVRGTEFNTGDGLSMALEAGAERYGDWSGCHSIGTDYNAPKVGDFTKPGDIFKKHSYPLGIMLNKEGRRFVDEGADFRNYTYAKYGREILKQPEALVFQLYDEQVRSMLRSEYNKEEATFYKAATLEELAEMLDVDKNTFLDTVAAYNEAVQDGEYYPNEKDGKGTIGVNPPKSNWALRIEKGPFYAFPVTCGITFSFGGIRANAKGEILAANKQPIEGLYAAGEMIGGIFYENYPGGSGLMSGAVFGKTAGESAGTYVQKAKAQS